MAVETTRTSLFYGWSDRRSWREAPYTSRTPSAFVFWFSVMHELSDGWAWSCTCAAEGLIDWFAEILPVAPAGNLYSSKMPEGKSDPRIARRRTKRNPKFFLTLNFTYLESERMKLKLMYWPGFSRRRKWQGLKDDQDQFNMDKSKLNWG